MKESPWKEDGWRSISKTLCFRTKTIVKLIGYSWQTEGNPVSFLKTGQRQGILGLNLYTSCPS